MRKRNAIWPLTKKEAEYIRSLDHIFYASMSVQLALSRKDEKDSDFGGKAFLMERLKEWEKAVGEHCEKFADERDLVRELLGSYRRIGFDKMRMFRQERRQRMAKEKP
jgi:hypothetical protein